VAVAAVGAVASGASVAFAPGVAAGVVALVSGASSSQAAARTAATSRRGEATSLIVMLLRYTTGPAPPDA
jgi:hypothetical protein